jgi:hypothetical protein
VLKASKTFSGPCLVAQKILQGKLKTGSENTFPFVAIKRRVIQRMVRTAPVCGPGAIWGDRSLVSRPESSWVAGRTGFGPVHNRECMGSTDMVGNKVSEAGPSVLGVPEQNVTDLIINSDDEVIPAGEDKIIQTCYMENSDVGEAYRGRDTSSKGKSKVLISENGSCNKGNMEENSLQSGTYDQGVGQLNNENPLVENTVKMSMEVSKVAGLSWEGQEGRKEECFRRIVVENFESGRGVDSINFDFQPAAKIMGRFWGNDSDDEA